MFRSVKVSFSISPDFQDATIGVPVLSEKNLHATQYKIYPSEVILWGENYFTEMKKKWIPFSPSSPQCPNKPRGLGYVSSAVYCLCHQPNLTLEGQGVHTWTTLYPFFCVGLMILPGVPGGQGGPHN